MPNTCFWPPWIVNPGNMDEDDFFNKHHFKYVEEKRWGWWGNFEDEMSLCSWQNKRQDIYERWGGVTCISSRDRALMGWVKENRGSKSFQMDSGKKTKRPSICSLPLPLFVQRVQREKLAAWESTLLKSLPRLNTNFGGNMQKDQGYIHVFS